MASDLVAALRPPLVSAARTAGTLELAWSTRLVVICTTWPLPCFSIAAMASCRHPPPCPAPSPITHAEALAHKPCSGLSISSRGAALQIGKRRFVHGHLLVAFGLLNWFED